MRQLAVDVRGRDRDRTRHDERRRVLPHPQCVDHGRHQPQDPASPLESLQARPVFIEGVEELGVDGVSQSYTSLIGRVACLAGEVVGVFAIHLDIGLCRRRDLSECRRIRQGEEALLDDVIRLVGLCRVPLVRHPADDSLKSPQRFEAVGTAHFLGTSRGVLVHRAGVRRRDRDREHDPARPLGCFGEGLGESELIVEGPTREVITPDEGPGVGNPLIDEDHGRGVRREQSVQRSSGMCALAVRFTDDLVCRRTPKLPREFSPDRVDVSPVVLVAAGGLQLVPDDGDPIDLLTGVAAGGEEFLGLLREGAHR